MSTGQTPAPSSVRRAQMMRETWRPVGRRLAREANSVWDYLIAHPPLTQGVYYVLTGLWPWVSMASFLWVTGDKTDLWLVRTVAALIVVIGATLCVAAFLREHSWAITCLAVGSAAALAFVDVLFVAQNRIPPIYLLDAVVQGALIGLWLYAWQQGRYRPTRDAVPTAVAVPGPANAEPETSILGHPVMPANPALETQPTMPSATAWPGSQVPGR